jgi:hypothetical protein
VQHIIRGLVESFLLRRPEQNNLSFIPRVIQRVVKKVKAHSARFPTVAPFQFIDVSRSRSIQPYRGLGMSFVLQRANSFSIFFFTFLFFSFSFLFTFWKVKIKQKARA